MITKTGMWIKLKPPKGGGIKEMFLERTDYENLTEILKEKGYGEWKVLDWTIQELIYG